MKFIFALIWILIFVILANFHLRGITPYDEGQILNAAQKILDGQLPYRDFQFFYTPGTILSLAVVFKLFGASVLAERLFALSVSLISVILVFKISKFFTKDLFISYLSVFSFVFWGPAIVNFIWPVMICIMFGLLSTFLLIKYLNEKNLNLLFFAGFTSCMVFIFKQNFGAVFLLSSLVFLFLMPNSRNRRVLKTYLAGYLLSFFSFFIYLAATGSLQTFVEEMYLITYSKILKEGMLATPFIYGGVWYVKLIRTFLYLFPLIIAAFAVKIGYKKNKEALILPLFTGGFYLAGIRPTTDLVHLAPLIAISSLSIIILLFSLLLPIKYNAPA